MNTIVRKVLANMLGLISVLFLVSAFVVQASTPYGFALTDGGGRLTDLGCYLLVLGIMGLLAAMLPFARWVDETGRWKG